MWIVNPDGTQALSPTPFLYLPRPKIITVSPGQGPASGLTDITISGQDFMADPDGLKPDVLFCTTYDDATGASTGCVPADPATVTAPSNGLQIFVRTPAHAPVSTQVMVVAPDGQRDVLHDAFRFTEVPAISSISPDTGPADGGQVTTLFGTGFQFGASVLFDGVPATNVNVRSATEIGLTTPANAQGPADVTVRNLDGGFKTVLGLYTYVPRPLVTSSVPNLAPETGGVTATLTGKFFFQTVNVKPKVFFGVTQVAEADVVFQSSTALQVVVPPGRGAVDIKVQNPDGQTGLLIDGFSYIPPLPAPTIAYVVPVTGLTSGAEPMRIVGSDFLLAARAFIGKPDRDGDGTLNELGQDWAEVTDVEVRQNGTLIVGETPAYSPGVFDVMVLNSDGQMAVKPNAFTYVVPPSELSLAVLNIEPKRSVIQGGGYVTIGGTGFRANITVRFDGRRLGGLRRRHRARPDAIRAHAARAQRRPARSPSASPTRPTPDKPLEAIDAVDLFEYVSGPVFARAARATACPTRTPTRAAPSSSTPTAMASTTS
ncbi:MAG: IPT/TIG domain-containing protein [Myxococcota bacterium]